MGSSGRNLILMDDPYFDPDGETMQFRLTYEGKLLGNGNASHKHEIRRVFHPQLRRLWNETRSLRAMRDPVVDLVEVNRGPDRSRVEGLAERFTRNNYQFVPLVSRDLDVSFCGLDILFLRPDIPGSILRSGDIDNRLKTLFDALRMPTGRGELGGYDYPEKDEKPFYCLLEDDSLVTKVSVETDLLLEPVNDAFDVNDARIIVAVTIQPASVRLDLRFHSVNFR
jgi:hypothetical protein